MTAKVIIGNRRGFFYIFWKGESMKACGGKAARWMSYVVLFLIGLALLTSYSKINFEGRNEQ